VSSCVDLTTLWRYLWCRSAVPLVFTRLRGHRPSEQTHVDKHAHGWKEGRGGRGGKKRCCGMVARPSNVISWLIYCWWVSGQRSRRSLAWKTWCLWAVITYCVNRHVVIVSFNASLNECTTTVIIL